MDPRLSLYLVRKPAADLAELAELQTVLGENTPKTFAEFQDLKYNELEKWNFLKLDCMRQNELINHPQLALPKADTAISLPAKFTKYLFNPENPVGWAKGQAFTSRLGYSKENWKELQREILQGAKRYPAIPKLKDDFGQRYEQHMVLYGRAGRPANVVVGWIQKADGTVSMTTAYIKEVNCENP